MTDTLASITTWHQRARPAPTNANFNVQLGCHIEEFCEMLEALSGNDESANAMVIAALEAAEELANCLKAGEMHVTLANGQRQDLLDSLADQIVTAVGVGHCAKMKVTEACKAVDTSNWSKFGPDGQPIFHPNGKIMKGLDYATPNLEGLF